MIEWLFIFKWSNILWLWDTRFNSTVKLKFFFGVGGGGVLHHQNDHYSIFDRFDWKKKINMHSIIVCQQTEHHMSYKCNIYNIRSNFISKGTIFWNTKIVQYWWIFIIIQINFFDNYISQQEYQEIQTTTLTTTKMIQQLDNFTMLWFILALILLPILCWIMKHDQI